MGSRVSPNSNCWHVGTPYSLCNSHQSPRPISSLPLGNVIHSNSDMPCRLVNRSALCGSRNLRLLHGVKRACFAHYDDFHHRNAKEFAYAVPGMGSTKHIWTEKPDILEPSLLGIQPESPSWPERDEILRLNFERKVNSVEIPLSILMIKKKLQWQKGVTEESELTNCSVKKMFSSLLFIIHELQNYALKTRESLYCEDLQGVMAKLQGELDASFVWLFQQIFWKTPSLMVNVMVLLANFSVFSICNNAVVAVTSPSKNKEVLSLTNIRKKQQHSQGDQDENRKELTEEEEVLWKSMLEEASRWKMELHSEALDHETVLGFVAPVSVQIEGDQYEEYDRTRLYYRRHLRQAPYNSLVLSNYAQFLYLFLHDLDGKRKNTKQEPSCLLALYAIKGAEEYFKLSVLVEPPDAEAFSKYADFLWLVRNDLWAAEQRYQQAVEADTGNACYYASKYANFLWSTGGTDTCFPV
ncbi:Tetratricopeptide-like helical domain superfamily [Sesbania bispinosa]|nr:Tetratricopeptide-like helical domain superfamily [Sesbania bispinosa]